MRRVGDLLPFPVTAGDRGCFGEGGDALLLTLPLKARKRRTGEYRGKGKVWQLGS